MANVTKIKFQYFKPLEKGTTEHTGGPGTRAGGRGGAARGGRGAGDRGGGRGRGGARREARPSPTARSDARTPEPTGS